MNNTTLEKIISDTQSSPYIKWNDESLTDLIRNDNVYNVFIFKWYQSNYFHFKYTPYPVSLCAHSVTSYLCV